MFEFLFGLLLGSVVTVVAIHHFVVRPTRAKVVEAMIGWADTLKLLHDVKNHIEEREATDIISPIQLGRPGS